MAQARAVINIDVNTSAAAGQLRALQNQINSFSATLSKNNLVQAEAAQRFSSTLMDAVSSTRFFTAEQVRMETAARRLDQTLSKGQGTLAQYFNARFRKDSAEAASVLSLANSRAQALQTTFYETTAAVKGFRDVIAVRPLAAFNTETAVANERLAIHRAMLRQATTSMINFGKNTQWAGRQLMVGFTVPLAIFGGSAAKTFKEIEQAAVRFKKVYGDAFTPPEEIEQNMRAVEALALEYTKYGIAVKDTISLAAEAAAAGAQNADLLAATTEATRLATLGQMEQNEALTATIALQNAFRLSSTQLATEVNFLNMVENQTVVTLQDLAEAIPRVAPVIVGLGGDVRDMAAMLAAMQEGGVSAAQGANALKSGLGSLINPTKQANETLAKMGINLEAIVQANRGDLMGTVQAFGRALSTLDQFSRQQALEEVFGKYQYARLGALFDNIIKDGTQASRVLQIAGMSAEQMAASAEKELRVISEATSTKYMAAIERFKMAIAPIGELFMKISTPIINFFSKLFEMFDKLPEGVKNFAALATVIVGVVVPAGTMFLGLLMNLVGTLIKFGSVVSSAIRGFGQSGFAGAIQAVSQSLNYMSLEEMDAANAAQQLGIATRNANTALLAQITSADTATAAFTELAAAINLASAAQAQYAQLYPSTFAPGATAASTAASNAPSAPPRVRRRNKGGPIFLNEGNTVPGFGNKDTVPAMLTPGEFVVNKKATEKNLPLLYAINNGAQVPGFNTGGGVAKFGKMFYGMKIQPGSLGLDLENIPPAMLARLLELRGAKTISSGLPTQASTAGQNFITLPQLTAQQRADLTSALQEATPRLQGVNPVQLLGNLVGAGPRRINSQARFGKASKEEMAFLSGLSEFYLPAFTSVPSAKAALQALKLSPTQAADRLASTLGQKFLSRPGMRVSDTQIYDEVAKGFDEAGLSSIYSALINDKNAIRYTMPTEVSNELRKIMVTGAGNANVHEQLLTRAFGRQSVTNFRDSQGRPGYVVSGSQLGLSKDLLLMPGQTYPTGTGMSYEDIPLTSVQRMLQDTFIKRGYSVSDSDIQRMHLGMNKGGMIPGVQYFAAVNKGRVVEEAAKVIGRSRDLPLIGRFTRGKREYTWKTRGDNVKNLIDEYIKKIQKVEDKEKAAQIIQDYASTLKRTGGARTAKTLSLTNLYDDALNKTLKDAKLPLLSDHAGLLIHETHLTRAMRRKGKRYVSRYTADYDYLSNLQANQGNLDPKDFIKRNLLDPERGGRYGKYEKIFNTAKIPKEKRNKLEKDIDREIKKVLRSSIYKDVKIGDDPGPGIITFEDIIKPIIDEHVINAGGNSKALKSLAVRNVLRKASGKNSGGLIDGVQYLVGGGPAIGGTLRRILTARQRKILAAEPGQTLESAAQQYADHGYASLTAAQRVLLSQSREPFAGPQLFRGAGGSSPLIDRKLRDRLTRGSYRDIIDLEGEMIPFPKGSWSTDERIAFDHMRYFASENQEWSNAIDMLTVRGSVPLYGSTYKEHIKGEQANVIRKIKELKDQLKQAQDRMSPERIAQEEARIEQLRLAVEQERKSARSKLGFTEDQDLTLTERASISDAVRESKAQRDYDIAKKSHKTNLENPTELQRRIDEQIKGLYYKRNARKQAFAKLERLRQQGSNVQVFFKATKSDRYIPPGQAKISYIQDVTEGDPNDLFTTKLYVIGLDMGHPEMVDISGKPFARHGGRTNEYEFIRQNKGGLIPIQNFNTGGVADPVEAFATRRIFESGGQTIVPGVGNTDTVPAMLTPGEFVINKEATLNNLPLLHAINNGKVAGYVTGGEVRPWGGNQYVGPGWHVYDAANQKIKDPNTGKAIVFQTREEADAALKAYQDRVAERFKTASGGKDISGQNDKLYPGKIEQDRNSPGDERFGKWVVYDDDGKEISRHQTLEQAKEGLAKFRQDSRRMLLGSLKAPLTGKQKLGMLVSTAGIAALMGTLGAIMGIQRNAKDEEFFAQSNVKVKETEPSKWTLLNDGDKVPGSGNKDTVPAMLTPGEFVVNKRATSSNLELLHAINDGNIVQANTGGLIPGPQYLAMGGMAKMMGAQLGIGLAGGAIGSVAGGAMGGDTGAMIGGLAGSIIPGLLLPQALGGLMGAGGGGAAAAGLLLNPITGVVAALAAAIIATTYTFYKLSESNQKEFEAGRRLADAMTTSASEIEALGTSAKKRAENMSEYLNQEEDDFIEAKYNRKIARAKTEAERNRLKIEKEYAMELAGGKKIVSESIDQFYKKEIITSKQIQPLNLSGMSADNAERASIRRNEQPTTPQLYELRNRALGLKFAKPGPIAQDLSYGKSFIQGAGKETFESVKAMRDLPNQFAAGQLSAAQYQAVLDTGKAAYGQAMSLNQVSEKDLAAKLSQYILSGVMTQDQASSVAAAIGQEIKDSGFGQRVANEVIGTVGAEGAIAKYSPGKVAEKLAEQSQRRVDEYQKRIEKTMPQFFAPDTFGSKATGAQGIGAAIGGPTTLFGSQAFMDIERTKAREEFLKTNATPTMQEMANWRETFFTSFFSGMADQLRRDMGGFLEASIANLQMLEENIAAVQLGYNKLISEAETLQEKDRLRYEQSNTMADLIEKKAKAQEQVFAPFGGREAYSQTVMNNLEAQKQTFGYKVGLGADFARTQLGIAQTRPVGMENVGQSILNVGNVIARAFDVGAMNVAQTLNNVFGNFGDWLNKTGFGEGLTMGDIYAGQLAEQSKKAFEGTQLGVNLGTLEETLLNKNLGSVSGENIDTQLFFLRQLGLQDQSAATSISSMITQAMSEYEMATVAGGGVKKPGEYALTDAQARAAQERVGIALASGQLENGQQLNTETITNLATAFPTMGAERLDEFLVKMTELKDQGPAVADRLAGAFAQMGNSINVTTTSGKSMYDMLLNNKEILSDDQMFENVVKGGQYFEKQSVEVQNALARFITGPESFAEFGKAIEEANPKKFNRDLNLLESNLRKTTKSLKIPKENRRDWKYVLDTFNRIDKIKDPEIRAKLEAEIEPQVMTMMKLVEELQTASEDQKQIIIDQIIEINQSIQTKVTSAEGEDKKKKQAAGGGVKADPLGEAMRELRDKISAQAKIGTTIEATGQQTQSIFARLRKLGLNESVIDFFKSMDPKTALEVGKKVLNDRGKLNTLLSLMSQEAFTAQQEATAAAKNNAKFAKIMGSARAFTGLSSVGMSQAFQDEEFIAGLQKVVDGAANNKEANRKAREYALDYMSEQKANRQQQAATAGTQLRGQAALNMFSNQATQNLQSTLGLTTEEASIAMQNETINNLMRSLYENGQSINDLSEKNRQAILDFIESQKTSVDKMNEALNEVKDELNDINTVLQDASQYIEEYNIKPLQNQLDDLSESSANYQEDTRRLQNSLSKIQEEEQKIRDKAQEKEKEINDTYNQRIEALDDIKRANELIANQQRGQLDIASALSRGDIAAAAQASLQMQQTMAQQRTDELRTGLTRQKDNEIEQLRLETENQIKNLTVEHNGELLNREQIESRIKSLNDKIYENSLKQYDLEKQITAERDKQQKINDQIDRVNRTATVVDRVTEAATQESGQRGGDINALISGLRLENTAASNAFADYISSQDLNNLDPNSFLDAIRGPLATYLAATSQQIGTDVTGLINNLQIPLNTTVGDSIANIGKEAFDSLTTGLDAWNKKYKEQDPFKILEEGFDKFMSKVQGKLRSPIPGEPGSGGPGDTTTDGDLPGANNEIYLPPGISVSQEDAAKRSDLRSRTQNETINGTKYRVTRYYDNKGNLVSNLTKYEMGQETGTGFGMGTSYREVGEAGVTSYFDQTIGTRGIAREAAWNKLNFQPSGVEAYSQYGGGRAWRPINPTPPPLTTSYFGGGDLSGDLTQSGNIDQAFKFATAGIKEKAQSGGEDVGKSFVEGAKIGISTAASMIHPSIGLAVNTIITAWEFSQQSGSPAKHPKIIGLGKSFAEGVQLGINDYVDSSMNLIPVISKISEKLATAFNTIPFMIENIGKAIAESIITGIQQGIMSSTAYTSIRNNLRIKLSEILGTGVDGTNSSTHFQPIGKGITNGMLKGVNDSIVNDTLQFPKILTSFLTKLNTTFATTSSGTPSNKTEYIGSSVIGGIINGMNSFITRSVALFTGVFTSFINTLAQQFGTVDAKGQAISSTKQEVKNIGTGLVGDKNGGIIGGMNTSVKMSAFNEFVQTFLSNVNRHFSSQVSYLSIIGNNIAADIYKGLTSAWSNATGPDGSRLPWRGSGPERKELPDIASFMFGGMVNYKGSNERAPGLMFGGVMKKYATGSYVAGQGMTDKVPALLTPGEFVVRKSVAREYGPLLENLNSQIYPKHEVRDVYPGVPTRYRQNGIDSLVTIGESNSFVPINDINSVNRSVIDTSTINANTFPNVSNMISNVNPVTTNVVTTPISNTNYSPMLYNYNINVVAQTNSDPNDIANAITRKIEMKEQRMIRGTRING